MMNSLQKFAKKNKLILVAIILMMVFFLMKTYETFVDLDRYSHYYNLSNDKKTNTKTKSAKKVNSKSCNLLYKSHANKCYDCEDELANTDRSYQSQKSKCFSCEEDLKNRFGSETAFKGQPSKCFDCEDQLSGKKSKSKSK